MQNFEVISTLNEAQAMSLHELFQQEWWTKGRTFDEVKVILANSLSIALVERATKHLVAYSRVVTDRVYIAHILDVIVYKPFRSKNVGKQLLNAILSHPDLKKVLKFELKCLPNLIPFYEKCGFTVPTTELTVMTKVQ